MRGCEHHAPPSALWKFHCGHDTGWHSSVVVLWIFLRSMAGRLRASPSASVDCLLPPVPFTKRERQAARLHRVSLQRDSVRHNSNCRSPRPRPGRDRRACARRAYGGVGPAPPVGGSPPLFCPLMHLFSWPTHRSSAFQWGRFRFHPSTYPEPYRHGISLRENTE